MPMSITLKNIPDDIYLQLKTAALANRRSLNSEAIVWLEASHHVANIAQTSAQSAILARAIALRTEVKTPAVSNEEMTAMKIAGRK
jgi:antitoxin FitA